jgi:hypothetical protein
VRGGGRSWKGLVIDVDATLVTAHSEKEQTAATFKGGWGYHPADHITVTDLALAQIPDAHRHGQPILVRADGAGATKAWLGYLHRLRRPISQGGYGLDLDYPVGFTMTEQVQAAILALPAYAWTRWSRSTATCGRAPQSPNSPASWPTTGWIWPRTGGRPGSRLWSAGNAPTPERS